MYLCLFYTTIVSKVSKWLVCLVFDNQTLVLNESQKRNFLSLFDKRLNTYENWVGLVMKSEPELEDSLDLRFFDLTTSFLAFESLKYLTKFL